MFALTSARDTATALAAAFVTALLFVSYSIAHPLYAFGYILLVAAAFSLFSNTRILK